MPSFASELEPALRVAVEGSSQGDEVLHATRAFFDQNPNGLDITEAITGCQRVGQMQIGRIGIATEHRGDTALRPPGGGLLERPLRENPDPQSVPVGGADRGGKTGDAGAHHEEIEFSGLDHSASVLRA